MLPGIGFTEMFIIGIVAILLFGSRLPQVARNFGKSYGELRRGLSEIKSTIDAEIDESERSHSVSQKRLTHESHSTDDFQEPTGPKLELPTGDNTAESNPL